MKNVPIPGLRVAKSLQPEAGKNALVLAGGGVAGAIYELGALKAVDELLVERTVNDFDIYVGTSAGALVAAGLANGFSPEELFQAVDGTHPEIKPAVRRDILNLDSGSLIRRTVRWPRQLLENGLFYLRHSTDFTLLDLAWSVMGMLPASLYDSAALEKFTREMFAELGGSNRFDEMACELDIIATNLRTSERKVFNREQHEEVPVSRAVSASAAVPLLYKPVKIGQDQYVDGAVRGNASLDLAVERGATLVICINPLAPLQEEVAATMPLLRGKGGADSLDEDSMQSVMNQVFRTLFHANLHYHIKHLARLHPEVDFILLEPAAADEEMSSQNVMRYSTRFRTMEHAYHSISLHLAEHFDTYRAILANHEIAVAPRVDGETVAQLRASGFKTEAVREALARPAAYSYRQQRGDEPAVALGRALARLDMVLAQAENGE